MAASDRKGGRAESIWPSQQGGLSRWDTITHRDRNADEGSVPKSTQYQRRALEVGCQQHASSSRSLLVSALMLVGTAQDV